MGQQEIHEHEALGGGSGQRLYCRLTSLSQSLQTFLRITLDGTLRSPLARKVQHEADGDPGKRRIIKNQAEQTLNLVWWGKMDSNHRRHCQQIYSLSPLATREFPHMNFFISLVSPSRAQRSGSARKRKTEGADTKLSPPRRKRSAASFV